MIYLITNLITGTSENHNKNSIHHKIMKKIPRRSTTLVEPRSTFKIILRNDFSSDKISP